MIYVLNHNGQPLMPTKRHGKIRRLLRDNKAKVIRRCPFTIQLLYQTDDIRQHIVLGVDAGSKHIGLSATTDSEELFAAEVELRNDITDLISTRNVHHIESRKTGGNSPDNLITLCETCHKKYHKGLVELPVNIERKAGFKDAAFMGIMRWAVYDKLKELYPDVSMTYGYITKNTRIINNLQKSHIVDARCISGNPLANPLACYYYIKKTRCHNRQLHKQNFSKNHIRKNNQSPYMTKGFRLFDKVLYDNQICFITGRRQSGYFKLSKLDRTIIHNSASYKKIKLLEKTKTYLIEERK